MRILETDSRTFQGERDLSSLSNAERIEELGSFSPEKSGRLLMGLHMYGGVFFA